jgi:dTDP-D-glucose 4,6-dehydratase
VEAVENNVISHVSLLETCKQYGKLKQFIHISTDEVYGDSGLGIDEKGKEEEARLAPGNPYAATKASSMRHRLRYRNETWKKEFQAAAEAYSHCYATSLPLIIVRINNIYGPNQWNVKLVPRFIEMARSKTPFPVQGTGQQLRSWLHVNDASEGIRAIVERGKLGQTYNLGTYFEMNGQ